MFTGLVQAVGRLQSLPDAVRVSWSPQHWTAEGLAVGDSVAVDGVCLTARKLLEHGFEADVSPETLSRTTLGERARSGAAVNLEPALRLADRLGGHLVSGHIDGLGRVEAISRQGHSWDLQLAWDDPLLGRYICEKGSVAVNGISLTVAACHHDGASFSLAVIPHTWEQTTLQELRCGDAVNLEADLLAKYVERLLPGSASTDLTPQWMAENGWNV